MRFCECRHADAEHAIGIPEVDRQMCIGKDSYGVECTCDGFVEAHTDEELPNPIVEDGWRARPKKFPIESYDVVNWNDNGYEPEGWEL